MEMEINPPREDGAPEGLRGIHVVPNFGLEKTREGLLEEGCSESSLDDPAEAEEQPDEEESVNIL